VLVDGSTILIRVGVDFMCVLSKNSTDGTLPITAVQLSLSLPFFGKKLVVENDVQECTVNLQPTAAVIIDEA
jgi:hypothetical protein